MHPEVRSLFLNFLFIQTISARLDQDTTLQHAITPQFEQPRLLESLSEEARSELDAIRFIQEPAYMTDDGLKEMLVRMEVAGETVASVTGNPDYPNMSPSFKILMHYSLKQNKTVPFIQMYVSGYGSAYTPEYQKSLHNTIAYE